MPKLRRQLRKRTFLCVPASRSTVHSSNNVLSRKFQCICTSQWYFHNPHLHAAKGTVVHNHTPTEIFLVMEVF